MCRSRVGQTVCPARFLVPTNTIERTAMKDYEVTIVTKMQVYADGFQAAADLATSVAKGDRGKPDNCRVKDVVAESVRAL